MKLSNNKVFEANVKRFFLTEISGILSKKLFWIFISVLKISNSYSIGLIVTNNQIINGPNTYYYDYISVINNSTLTIKNSVIFIGQNQEIFVDIGSTLIVDNCIITAASSNTIPNYWKGIRVKGDFNAPQQSKSQGRLFLKNNSIIEKALVGISVGKLKYTDPFNTNTQQSLWYKEGGGIIIAENSTIKNCMFSVVFSPYYNTLNARPYSNISAFKNMKFIWDKYSSNELCYTFDHSYKTHVELNFVHDIRFIGCYFTNSIKYHTEWWKSNAYPDGVDFSEDHLGRGQGIYSFGSSFFIHSSGPCTKDNDCKKCDGNKNIFENLSVAINLQSHYKNKSNWTGLPVQTSDIHIEITDANFTNNNVSINGNYTEDKYEFSEISESDLPNNRLSNIFIDRCWFATNNSYYEYFFANHASDIFMSWVDNVEITNNAFIHSCKKMDVFKPSNHLAHCIGAPKMAYLRIDQSGTSPCIIKNNLFNDMDGSDEPCGKNIHSNYFSGQLNGLILECNTYRVDRFNYYDMNGSNAATHSDVTIVHNTTSISNFGRIGQSNGNIWSKKGTYNFSSLAHPYFLKPNNLTLVHYPSVHSTNPLLPINFYHFNNDLPDFVVYQDDYNFFNQKSNCIAGVSSFKFKMANYENTCTEELGRCRFYTPFEPNLNTAQLLSSFESNGIETTIELKYQLSLNPNPIKEDNATINLEPLIENGLIEGYIEIRDQFGNLLYKIHVSSNGAFKYVLDTSNLGSGIYYITFIDQSGFKKTIIVIKT